MSKIYRNKDIEQKKRFLEVPMQTVHTIQALHSILQFWRSHHLRVGFVPTMGNLHRGHQRLVEHALTQADRVIVSIFVNPLQFAAHEDIDRYPRTLEADQLQLAEIGAHALFAPEISALFPSGIEKQTQVIVPELSEKYCGASRPGHFAGVTTIVNKLFNIIHPDIAIFGEKDFQQLTIVQRMVSDLSLHTQILSVPIERDHDGLALSSRNSYLSPEERKIAPKLYQTLSWIRESILSGEKNYQKLCQEGVKRLKIAGFKPEYLEICRSLDLRKAQEDDADIIILTAVYLGKTRLIDNIKLEV